MILQDKINLIDENLYQNEKNLPRAESN